MSIDSDDIIIGTICAICVGAIAAFYLLIGASIADLFDADGAIYWLLTLAWPLAICIAFWLGSLIVMATVGIVSGAVLAIVAIIGAIGVAIGGNK
jgi:hypothetical protein